MYIYKPGVGLMWATVQALKVPRFLGVQGVLEMFWAQVWKAHSAIMFLRDLF